MTLDQIVERAEFHRAQGGDNVSIPVPASMATEKSIIALQRKAPWAKVSRSFQVFDSQYILFQWEVGDE